MALACYRNHSNMLITIDQHGLSIAGFEIKVFSKNQNGLHRMIQGI